MAVRRLNFMVDADGPVVVRANDGAGPPSVGAIEGVHLAMDAYGAYWEYNGTAWVQRSPATHSSAPTSPPTGYLWIDQANGLLKKWNGSAWLNPSETTVTAHGEDHVDGTDDVPDFVADAGGEPGVHGLVPASAAGDAAAGKVLKADGAWGAVALSELTMDAAEEVADAAAATSSDGEIAALTFSATVVQAEAEALRDKCELAGDDARAALAAVAAVITALKTQGILINPA